MSFYLSNNFVCHSNFSMGLSLELKWRALLVYIECGQNYSAFSMTWREISHLPTPSRKFMNRLNEKYRNRGTVAPKRKSGRPRSKRTWDVQLMVALHFTENPTSSPDEFVKTHGLCSRSSVRRILKEDLGLKPFKPKILHKLNLGDYSKRYWFCHYLLKTIEEKPDMLSNMIFFDEIHLKLNEIRCTRNLYYYSDKQPNMQIERSTNGAGIMVLVGISVRGVLIYFFDSEDLPHKFARKPMKRQTYRALPANSSTFLYLLTHKIMPDLEIMFPDLPSNEIIPVLDGASLHRESSVTSFLTEHFKFWLGNNSSGTIQWPPRSPGKCAS